MTGWRVSRALPLVMAGCVLVERYPLLLRVAC